MISRLVPGYCLLALVAGCASPAEVENMIVIPPEIRDPIDLSLKNAVCVNQVTGGEETNPLWTSEVDNPSFRSALTSSLMNHGLVATETSGCAYDLNANLLGLAQPGFGFDMEVTAHVNYEVLHHASDDPYFLESVSTAYTATVGDAFAGIKRLRLANEGAVKKNIEEFIRALLMHNPS
jgi:hypothetical protein